MAKKNYMGKIGGTAAVAMAMTVALSAQVHAAEVEELDLLSADTTTVDTESTSNAANSAVVEPAAVNQNVEESNADIIDSNNAVIENNQQADQNNTVAGENNESSSEGSLADPGLSLPDAPVAPDTDGMNATDYNEAVGEYNENVQDYNTAVDSFNDSQAAIPGDPTTSDGTQQGDGTAIDWGNVEFDTYGGILTHMDVKYNAAASQDVTVDAEGKPSYSEAVTQYEVTGVFTDKDTADSEMAKAEKIKDYEPAYGLSYSNDNWNTSTDQDLQDDPANDEFGNVHANHLGESLDPVKGEVSFYVTLVDEDGNTHGINVNVDANSVYAEGSFYKAESNDFLKSYIGKNNKKLDTETIDGVTYYDISGESVFLISALTCDGMTEGMYWKPNDYGWGGQWVSDGKLHAHGLDLILNMQTMIEIHKGDNAQKISYLDYKLG